MEINSFTTELLKTPEIHVNMIYNFYIENGRFPSYSSKNIDEKILYVYLSQCREEENKNSCNFILSRVLLYKIFGSNEIWNNKYKSINAEQVYEFFNRYGYFPSINTTNERNYKLGCFLSDCKNAELRRTNLYKYERQKLSELFGIKEFWLYGLIE